MGRPLGRHVRVDLHVQEVPTEAGGSALTASIPLFGCGCSAPGRSWCEELWQSQKLLLSQDAFALGAFMLLKVWQRLFRCKELGRSWRLMKPVLDLAKGRPAYSWAQKQHREDRPEPGRQTARIKYLGSASEAEVQAGNAADSAPGALGL